MKFKSLYKLLLCVLAFTIVFSPVVNAQEDHKYSFENAEKLKGRIDWHDYSTETFAKAIDQNKPIFLLLTAPSWCYWCQVYESEDYLFDSDVVETINEKYVPIYVDADQRQDLTREYLEGGWPSTTVMDPEKNRLFGFSGVRDPSTMVETLDQTYRVVKNTVYDGEFSYDYRESEPRVPSSAALERKMAGYESRIRESIDVINGGFGSGQKFPQGLTLYYALTLYKQTNDEYWLEIVETTLEGQFTEIDELRTNYNLFDPVEGGFHRYGTQVDWSPPHYEKMLYDNARLLQAYHKLKEINPDNEYVDEVNSKTLEYINDQWKNPDGGFWANTDVAGEDAYYGEIDRGDEPARVEKSVYTDWNSELILSYLEIYKLNSDENFLNDAKATADFITLELMTESNGVMHYYQESSNTRGITGGLTDNAYFLYALTELYKVTEDEKYIETINILDNYMKDNLYDWQSGGFFNRNSTELDSYALGDHIDLDKPYIENSLASMAYLNLYEINNDDINLYIGLTALNETMGSGYLDREYFSVVATKKVIDEGHLIEYADILESVSSVREERLEDFWLEEVLNTTISINNIQDLLDQSAVESIQGKSFVLLLFISFFAGLISFISPCTLPILPTFFAFNSGQEKGQKLYTSLGFILGLSVTLAILGVVLSAIGGVTGTTMRYLTTIIGAIVIFMGINELIGFKFVQNLIARVKIPQLGNFNKVPKGFLGGYGFGSVMSIAWSPCYGPILLAISVLATQSDSRLSGAILLCVYGLGLGLPLVLISYYFEKYKENKFIEKVFYDRKIYIANGENSIEISLFKILSAFILIGIGILIISGSLTNLNSIVGNFDFQQGLYEIEDRLLG